VQPHRWLLAAVVALGLSPCNLLPLPGRAGGGADPDVLEIGIVDSLVKDLSAGKREVLKKDFPDLVQEFAGLKSRVILGGSPFAAAQKLSAGQWHLAVLPGIEYAWAKGQDAKLQPLLAAINRQPTVHALVVVKKDSPAKGFADLKGKAIHVVKSREHCRLFLDKGAVGDAHGFFSKVSLASIAEDALDDVLRGKVQAAVVDNADLALYKDVNPGRFDRVKVLAESEPFPPTVIAYQKGALSDRVLEKLRAGMLKANGSERGRDVMSSVRITAFEPVPADFPQLLSSIVKAYPAPGK
jgi:ABC-type phosphate/phosphonate transport system substrate-binding protein